MLIIKLPSGEEKTIIIQMFAALDGWDIQNRFIDFAASVDASFRRAFTLEVLAYAKVLNGEVQLPLITSELIDNHLQTWENVKAVFEAVLMHNGINPLTHADKSNHWAEAGEEMAVSFIAAAAKLMGPALFSLNESVKG